MISKTSCPFCAGIEFQTTLSDGLPWHKCEHKVRRFKSFIEWGMDGEFPFLLVIIFGLLIDGLMAIEEFCR